MGRVLLGVCGGIAAYKALEFVRLATGDGHAVRVVQTPTSQHFVGAASFAALTGAPVLTDEFERDPARGAFPDQESPAHDPLSHLELVANADVFLIAPASANTVAKLSQGLADNLLTSAALAATCPVIVAPAMNNHMWEHAATQANVATLRARGVTVLEPGVGRLGSKGEWGAGRLPEPEALLAAVRAALAPTTGDLDGVRVLITAGGTREPLDSVRYLGNRSSGRMGWALAQRSADRGADVTVIAANVSLARDPRVTYVDVQTADELHGACEALLSSTDLVFMAAAVVDFRPRDVHNGKLKKGEAESLALSLERTPDILASLARTRGPGQTLIGFAAEHGDGALSYGREKLVRKGVDAIVVNDIGRSDIGFDVDQNEVTIVTAAGERHVPRATKLEVADVIVSEALAVARIGRA